VAGLPFGSKGEGSSSVDETSDKGNTVAAPEQPSKRESKRAAKQQAKYGVFDPSELKKGRGIFGFLSTGGGKLTILSVILALIAGYGVYAVTSSSTTTVQQLVLLNDVPSNTLLTMSDVQPVEVPADSVPDVSLLVTPENIASGRAYTKVALKRNTVLTLGSVGPYSRLSEELPEGMQLVSIVVSPENAAGGSIAAGDIVDIFGSATGDLTSSVFINGMKGIQVLEVIVNPADIAKGAVTDPVSGESTVGSDSPDLKSGLGSVYKLAVTPTQASAIANAVTSGVSFYLVLTSGVSETPGASDINVSPLPTAEVPNPILDNPVGEAITGIIPSDQQPSETPVNGETANAETSPNPSAPLSPEADIATPNIPNIQ
jgi:Flp pilus assembly protein CpaB